MSRWKKASNGKSEIQEAEMNKTNSWPFITVSNIKSWMRESFPEQS